MKKLTAFLMALILLVSMCACTGTTTTASEDPATTSTSETETQTETQTETPAQPAQTDSQESVVTIAYTTDPGAVAPFAEGSQTARNFILSYTYEKLAMQGTDGLELIIAKDYYLDEENSTPDAQRYIVEIYDYVHDSEGNPITADDVVWSLLYLKENGSGNAKNNLRNYVSEINKIDDYTVELVLNQVAVGKIEQILTGGYILSQKAFEASEDGMANKIVATGPYLLDEWVAGSSVTLKKNENYWQKSELCNNYQKSNVDKIVYRIYTEAAQMVIALETGEVDVCVDLNYSQASRFMEGGESSNGMSVFSMDNTMVECLLLNRSEDSVLNDTNLAKAVLYAIDSQSVMDGAYDGYGTVVKCLGGPNCWDYVDEWDDMEYYPYDLDKAKELVAESNYQGETLKILCANSEVNTKEAQIIQNFLQQAGINAEVTAFESALWTTYQQDTYMYDINVTSFPANMYITKSWEQMDSGFFEEHNLAGIVDEELNELLRRCNSEHTSEVLTEAHIRMTETAQAYGMYVKSKCCIYNSGRIAEANWTYQGYPIPGSFVLN